jgi:hypothetical protein
VRCGARRGCKEGLVHGNKKKKVDTSAAACLLVTCHWQLPVLSYLLSQLLLDATLTLTHHLARCLVCGPVRCLTLLAAVGPQLAA